MLFVFTVEPVILAFIIKVLVVMAFPIMLEKEIMLVERKLVLIVDPVIVNLAIKVLAVIAFPTMLENRMMLVDIVFALIEEADIVEFTVKVLTAIAFVMTVEADMEEFNTIVFPVMVEKKIWLVDILLVLKDDVIIVEFTTMVLAVRELPAIVTNPILFAVSVPLVFDVNVLMVDPVAVLKYKLVAIKLFPTVRF